MKGDLEQAHDLAPYFDWNLTEECYQYRECTRVWNQGPGGGREGPRRGPELHPAAQGGVDRGVPAGPRRRWRSICADSRRARQHRALPPGTAERRWSAAVPHHLIPPVVRSPQRRRDEPSGRRLRPIQDLWRIRRALSDLSLRFPMFGGPTHDRAWEGLHVVHPPPAPPSPTDGASTSLGRPARPGPDQCRRPRGRSAPRVGGCRGRRLVAHARPPGGLPVGPGGLARPRRPRPDGAEGRERQAAAAPDVYDIDLEYNSAATVSALHAQGRR